MLPVLLRMVDPEEFAKYDSMTPTGLDYLADYRDGVQQLDYTLGVQGQNVANMTGQLTPDIFEQDNLRGPRSYISHPNNILAYDMNRPAGSAYYHRPRGSWKIRKLYAKHGNATGTPTRDDTEVYVEFEVCEPLLMSPFVFGSGHGKQGFYGVQGMNIQMNMLGNANRAWRSAVHKLGGTKTVSIVGFEDSQLLFQFLTPHASDMFGP